MKQDRRCVIIGAAGIRNYEKIRTYLREEDFYIYCDAGLKHQELLGVRPDLIIGDFDSYGKAEMEQKYLQAGASACGGEAGVPEHGRQAGTGGSARIPELIVLPCEKDDTDTVFAAKEALRRGFEDFLLVGVIGQRLDHTFGNVSILYMLEEADAKGIILDDYSEMQLITEHAAQPTEIEDSFAYFSLLNVSGQAEGITITNAKYPLQDASITCEYQYGISNEVLPGKTASAAVAKGKLLLIKVFA